jgi:iron complex transport system permease protein
LNRNRKNLILLTLVLSALFALAFAPLVGMKMTPLDAIFHPGSGGKESEIFWRLRMPRVSVSFLAGAALAISGMSFQALFRNPLATPFTLGVSSGAALGAALYIRIGLPVVLLGIPGISISAFTGAALSILLVYGFTRLRSGFTTGTMLLAGVAISFFFSSVNLFTQYISDFTQTFRIIRWLMGGLEVVGFRSVIDMTPFVIVGSVVILLLTHELNLLTTGEEIAASRGVNIRFVRRAIFFGPIGFVGMMSPHICRLLIGPDHRYLAPATLLFGGAFLTLCDTFARTIIAPAEIPVGVITALLGGPFFIWLLVWGDRDLL